MALSFDKADVTLRVTRAETRGPWHSLLGGGWRRNGQKSNREKQGELWMART